jgi:hypothetical protein
MKVLHLPSVDRRTVTVSLKVVPEVPPLHAMSSAPGQLSPHLVPQDRVPGEDLALSAAAQLPFWHFEPKARLGSGGSKPVPKSGTRYQRK